MYRFTKQVLATSAALVGATAFSSAALADQCTSVTFGAAFTGSYTCTSLGTPLGTTPNLGGLTFLNNNTILIGNGANGPAGTLQTLGVTRDGNNHITGFSTPSTPWGTAPYNDGGLTFGPGGVLFAAQWPVNMLAQYKPGSTAPDKVVSLYGSMSSLSALGFVPTGFAGAGQLKLVSYGGGDWATATLTPDGSGLFDITVGPQLSFNLQGGPEGFVYVDGANLGFGTDSLLVSEYGTGSVGIYDIDANGDPINGTHRSFLSGLAGAEGALIDPLTGDFIFSTFGAGNEVLVISGFIAPPPPPAVPEPASWAMMILGLGAVGAGLRRAKRTTRVSFA